MNLFLMTVETSKGVGVHRQIWNYTIRIVIKMTLKNSPDLFNVFGHLTIPTLPVLMTLLLEKVLVKNELVCPDFSWCCKMVNVKYN